MMMMMMMFIDAVDTATLGTELVIYASEQIHLAIAPSPKIPTTTTHAFSIRSLASF